MLKKFIFIIIFILYHSSLHSNISNNDFNQRYLSNYMSALVSFDRQSNSTALKHFNSSKKLLNKHKKFLERYVLSLVESGQVNKAIVEINKSDEKNLDFIEAKILLLVKALISNDQDRSYKNLNSLEKYKNDGAFEKIIYENLKNFTDLFYKNKITNSSKEFGNLGIIIEAFQECYLGNPNSERLFFDIVNSGEGEFSRYLFFYISSLIKKENYELAKKSSYLINELDSNLLLLQTKIWIDDKNFAKFKMYFSCDSKKDLLSELFFIIANLYSSQDNFIKSNFYLKISEYLNPKFYFNYSLLVENYYLNKNYERALEILKKLNKDDIIYDWYSIKKTAQVISETQSQEESLSYIEEKFEKINKPNIKILFDFANIHKNFEKYLKSIDTYTFILNNYNLSKEIKADILYRRGSSYERIKNFSKADEDFIQSLDLTPDDPYVLNYLAYSWLERDYKLDIALEMLKKAYSQKQNNAYIIDSLGWAYYLIGNYDKAEIYINQAIQLKPDDPVIMNHYGDILWKLNRKLQAKYFWENVLKINNFKEINKNELQLKLIKGI